MKDKLLPPTDRALSALLDDLQALDLQALGLLDSTLIVMGSEFGRTPKLSTHSESYPAAGRDHWGAVQSVFFAGGGIQGGTVVGSSDELGAYPASSPYKPENMAATMYDALGIPANAMWHDEFQRPLVTLKLHAHLGAAGSRQMNQPFVTSLPTGLQPPNLAM